MKKIVLIDAVFINNGGGKVLLIELVSLLKNAGFDIKIVLDRRLSQCKSLLKYAVVLVDSGLFSREFAIRKYSLGVDCIICFNNISPLLPLKIPVLVYFHNVSYLKKSIGLFAKLKKSIFLYGLFFSGSTWIVQTWSVKNELTTILNKFKINRKVEVFPFFPLNLSTPRYLSYSKINNVGIKFVYVSDGHYYKNHELLIRAFKDHCSAGFKSELHLTISESYPDLIKAINKSKSDRFSIFNHQNIPNDEIFEFMSKFDVAIYPSLFESFGLGLVEAAQFGIPIIASDLNYVHDVVKLDRVFDPFSVESIRSAMDECLFINLQPPCLTICDERNDFVDFIIGSCDGKK